jgi:hypothetical protein
MVVVGVNSCVEVIKLISKISGRECNFTADFVKCDKTVKTNLVLINCFIVILAIVLVCNLNVICVSMVKTGLDN